MQSVQKMSVGKKGLFAGLILTLVLVALFYSMNRKSPDSVWDKLDASSILQWPEDKAQSLEVRKSKIVLMHFWATWCKPCEEELPELLAFAKSISEKSDVKILAVSLDEDLDTALEFVGQKPSNWVNVLDSTQEFSKSIGTFQYPETIAVNSNGKIVMKWVGPQAWSSDQWQKEFLNWLSQTE